MHKVVNRKIPISVAKTHVRVLSCILKRTILPMNIAGKILEIYRDEKNVKATIRPIGAPMMVMKIIGSAIRVSIIKKVPMPKHARNFFPEMVAVCLKRLGKNHSMNIIEKSNEKKV